MELKIKKILSIFFQLDAIQWTFIKFNNKEQEQNIFI